MRADDIAGLPFRSRYRPYQNAFRLISRTIAEGARPGRPVVDRLDSLVIAQQRALNIRYGRPDAAELISAMP